MRAREVALWSKSLLLMGGSLLLLRMYRNKMKGFIMHFIIHAENHTSQSSALQDILETNTVTRYCYVKYTSDMTNHLEIEIEPNKTTFSALLITTACIDFRDNETKHQGF
jgi:hypothetical protein